MRPPTRLSHVVLQTNRLAEMRDWYCTVLAAKPVMESADLCFLTYDEEHHRIGLIATGAYADRDPSAAGLNHVSFTYESLETLLETHESLATAGILPALAVNHGPTVSLYYQDPDGNRIELQIDVFETPEEVAAFVATPMFQRNPVGTPFDPSEMLAQLRTGTPAAELVVRSG